jgi:ribosomal protein S18 acetylase RimI-like enzyme
MGSEILHVETGPLLDDVRTLFLEYAQSLNFNLCFQSFERELKELPGDYRLPAGRLVLSRVDGQPAGCVALRMLEPRICELKRLYVRREFRGHQLGKQLTDHVLNEARHAGYSAVRLDTVSGTMDRAIELYRSLGFKEIAPYYSNPIPNALYMELSLR